MLCGNVNRYPVVIQDIANCVMAAVISIRKVRALFDNACQITIPLSLNYGSSKILLVCIMDKDTIEPPYSF